MSDKPKTLIEKISELSKPVSEALDADILYFCGGVYPSEDRQISEIVLERKTRRTNVMLILNTFGGSADSAFRISRCIQRAYENGRFYVYVPVICKSAGTLIATGADEIIMGESAELGPLDVQRMHGDVAGRTSGLTPSQALNTLRDEVKGSFEEIFLHIRRQTRLDSHTAAEVAAGITKGLYAPIYEKFDPVNLGENDRALLIALEYSERLSKDRQLLRRNGIQKLIHGYPSHEFVIDLIEAKSIFQSLRIPDEQEKALTDEISFIVDEMLFNDEGDAGSLVMYFNEPLVDPEETNENYHNAGVQEYDPSAQHENGQPRSLPPNHETSASSHAVEKSTE